MAGLYITHMCFGLTHGTALLCAGSGSKSFYMIIESVSVFERFGPLETLLMSVSLFVVFYLCA